MEKEKLPEILNLALTFREIQLAFRRLASDLSVELPVESFGVLLAVYYNENLIQQDIAETLKKDKSAVLRQIDTLEAKQLVQRIADPQDRRKNIVKITDKGMSFIKEIIDKQNGLFALLSCGLDSEELEVFSRVVNHLRSMAKAI
ncbi:MAG: MarR family transcriptional regulator [Bacteroidales bacterium]|nr:MarR family transcriptional regulator [Bacteroidales bacterium]